MHKIFLKLAAVLTFATPLFGGAIPNADVTWGTPTNISGDSDVNTNGTLVMAYNFGTPTVADTTVNGVTFSAFGVSTTLNSQTATVGNLTLQETRPGYFLYGSNVTSTDTPFTGLTPAYQSLLGMMSASNSADTLLLQMSGLTVGNVYLFQLWSDHSDQATPFTVHVAANGYTSNVTLDLNTANTFGGLGQWVTGTFTAAGSSESIGVVGDAQPIINAMQVRQLAAVPEPGTTALMMGAIAGMVAIWRRKKQVAA